VGLCNGILCGSVLWGSVLWGPVGFRVVWIILSMLPRFFWQYKSSRLEVLLCNGVLCCGGLCNVILWGPVLWGPVLWSSAGFCVAWVVRSVLP
jgi:hypothetical protein